MDRFELPIVDFAPFSSLSTRQEDGKEELSLTEAQLETAQAIDAANREHGFVCLRNCGISKQVLKGAFKASKSLFAMDDHTKQETLKSLNPTTNTGYCGFQNGEALNRQRRADLKECFNIRGYSAENGDYENTPDGFQTAAVKFWDDMNVLGNRYSVCCAAALGLELDYFAKTLKTLDLCTLRMLHYPPMTKFVDNADNFSSEKNGSGNENDPTAAIRVGEHTDFGAFTFLFVHDFQDESSHGLQVKGVAGGDLGKGREDYKEHEQENEKSDDNNRSNKDGSASLLLSGWKDVVFDPDAVKLIEQDEYCAAIVNTGALMARWTNDEWKATAHRVVVKPQTQHSDRYSIALFFDPDKETICSVHPSFLKNGQEAKYPPISSLDYLMMKLREVQGKDK